MQCRRAGKKPDSGMGQDAPPHCRQIHTETTCFPADGKIRRAETYRKKGQGLMAYSERVIGIRCEIPGRNQTIKIIKTGQFTALCNLHKKKENIHANQTVIDNRHGFGLGGVPKRYHVSLLFLLYQFSIDLIQYRQFFCCSGSAKNCSV